MVAPSFARQSPSMLLQADPSLAEVPGFSTEQLERLTRSIELKKQRLEADIHAYVMEKQRELAQYEHEVMASMCLCPSHGWS